MKQTITYEKEYRYKINKSYFPEDRFENKILKTITHEEDEKDNLRNYLIEQSIEIEYEELTIMGFAGILKKISKPNKFLWFEKSLFHIELYEEDGKKKENYKRIVEITSMPPSKIPKTLEQKLIKKGFKKLK